LRQDEAAVTGALTEAWSNGPVTRSRSGRTTQKVERRNGTTGGWEPVANVNSATEVRAWAERTLGLGFDAFTASVLLRQGQADEIITATGARRLAILKKIIGAERYEALSARVHEAARLSNRLSGNRPLCHKDLRRGHYRRLCGSLAMAFSRSENKRVTSPHLSGVGESSPAARALPVVSLDQGRECRRLRDGHDCLEHQRNAMGARSSAGASCSPARRR
jgi:hypothetical protein